MNRKMAREIMQEKLDIFYNGEDSGVLKQRKEQEWRKLEKRKRARETLEKKRLFKNILADSKQGEDTRWRVSRFFSC